MAYGRCEIHGPFPPEAHCPECGLKSDYTFYKAPNDVREAIDFLKVCISTDHVDYIHYRNIVIQAAEETDRARLHIKAVTKAYDNCLDENKALRQQLEASGKGVEVTVEGKN